MKIKTNRKTQALFMLFSFTVAVTSGCSSPKQETETQNGKPQTERTANTYIATTDSAVQAVSSAISLEEMAYKQGFYVPIYSDIYVIEQNPNNLISATLSIRNTSPTQPLFISKIDYYNTEGNLVRNVLQQPIQIVPMGTYNHSIEKTDTSGGSGANFLITASAKQTIQPVIQAVMIGQYGNKAFAFTANGVPLSR